MTFPDGPIGFRLAHELEGLLRGVTADHVIVPEETERIRRWLSEAQQYAHIRPFHEIERHLSLALADGCLTIDEAEDLLFVICKLTTVNPYFNAVRAGGQQLMGLLAGVSADHVVNPHEARAMTRWCEEWEHLKGFWPFDECETILTTILNRGTWGKESEYLLALSRQFPVAGELDEDTGEVPPLLIGGICAVDPNLQFAGRRFTFTGESSRCVRRDLAAEVEQRQGIHWDNVTKETDYLIVCDEGNPLWAFSCYGRKVEIAYKHRRRGVPIVIVHERDFWDAIG